MRRVLPLLIGLLVVVALGSAQARPLADPIVGYWDYSGGVVQIAGSGTSFTGTVVKETKLATCAHPVGEMMWRNITKSGSGYTGTHQFPSNDGQCTPGGLGPGPTTFSISGSGGKPIMRTCITSPDDPSDTRCYNLTRTADVTSVTYRWSFRSAGRPIEGSLPAGATSTEANGAGNATFQVLGTSTTGTSASGTVRIFDRYKQRLGRVTFDVERAKNIIGKAGTTILVLGVKVTRSDYRGCKVGTRGNVTLFDGAGQLFDQFGFGVCGKIRVYDGDVRPPAEVTVTISATG